MKKTFIFLMALTTLFSCGWPPSNESTTEASNVDSSIIDSLVVDTLNFDTIVVDTTSN
jgi:hypothetical protein